MAGGSLRNKRIGIIGGGIVGVAIARALSHRTADVVVFEKEDSLAAHQTGRNSGVVHAGLYYQPGSLKAELCARGKALTREFCRDKRLPYREVGKLVVATRDSELSALDELERRSLINKVPGLRRLRGTQLREIEPHVAGIQGLHSPETAIVDYAAITNAMAEDVVGSGGKVLLQHEVTAIREHLGTVRIVAGGSEHSFDRVIVCAGLQSDVVAAFVGAPASPKILPFRGEYWAMDDDRTHLVRGMIYPVPDARFPFLGVHFTRAVTDEVHIGPNAVPALAREGYDWRTISFRDTWQSLSWPGAGPLARRHWRMGIKEVSASLLKPLYYREARRFVPGLKMSDLKEKTAAGVRAQAWDTSGELLDDFAIDRVGAVTVLRNAPSPAATSAMAIADYVLEAYLC